jgi:hypothetical protein
MPGCLNLVTVRFKLVPKPRNESRQRGHGKPGTFESHAGMAEPRDGVVQARPGTFESHAVMPETRDSTIEARTRVIEIRPVPIEGQAMLIETREDDVELHA